MRSEVGTTGQQKPMQGKQYCLVIWRASARARLQGVYSADGSPRFDSRTPVVNLYVRVVRTQEGPLVMSSHMVRTVFPGEAHTIATRKSASKCVPPVCIISSLAVPDIEWTRATYQIMSLTFRKETSIESE